MRLSIFVSWLEKESKLELYNLFFNHFKLNLLRIKYHLLFKSKVMSISQNREIIIECYHKYYEKLYIAGLGYLKSKYSYLVEDAINEVFHSILLLKSDKLEAIQNWESYLFSCMRYKCFEIIRKSVILITSTDEIPDIIEKVKNEDCRLANFCVSIDFERYLLCLSPEQYWVIRLRLMGRDETEIAEALDISKGAVRLRTIRAKAKFLQIFK